MPLFTFITPAYNSEKWINRCLASVIAQSFSDWEMIVVDDGSTDSTAKLLDGYSSVDSRIRVFHQDNRGWCAATNRAINLAVGEYIISLDSDNWIEGNTTLQNIADEIMASRPDFVQIPLKLIEEDTLKFLLLVPSSDSYWHMSNPYMIDQALEDGRVHAATHGGKAIKRRLINGLQMRGNPTGADSRVMMLLAAKSMSASLLPKQAGVLCCEMRTASLSHANKPLHYYLDWCYEESLLLPEYWSLFLQNKKRRFPQLLCFYGVYMMAMRECDNCETWAAMREIQKRVSKCAVMFRVALPARKRFGLFLTMTAPKTVGRLLRHRARLAASSSSQATEVE